MSEVPASKVDPVEAFQDRIKERVRNDIRDMLPDEAVAELVRRAVEEEFFRPRKVEVERGFSSRTEVHPSWFVEEVVKAATPIIKQAVVQAVADRPEVIEKVIGDFLDQNKLAAFVTAHLTDVLSGALFSFSDQVRQLTQR